MIARVWRGITHKDTADAYLTFLNNMALPGLAGKAGQRGGWVLRRYQGEHAEFVVLTLWESMDAIRAWVGGDPQQAVYTGRAWCVTTKPWARWHHPPARAPERHPPRHRHDMRKATPAATSLSCRLDRDTGAQTALLNFSWPRARRPAWPSLPDAPRRVS